MGVLQQAYKTFDCCLGVICGCCALLVAIVATPLVILLVKPVNDSLTIYSQKNLDKGPLLGGIQTVQFMAGLIPCISTTKAILVGCGRQALTNNLFPAAHGWKGVGIKGMANPGPAGLFFYSHEAVTEFVNKEELKRDPGMFVASNTQTWVDKGIVPEGFWPLVIQLDTSDPERVKRRTFMNDFFGALLEPVPLDLTATTVSTDVLPMVASSLIKELFGFYPDQQVLTDVGQWVKEGKLCALGKCSPRSGPNTLHTFERIYSTIAGSVVGKQFLSKAADIGFADPAARLKEILFITLFAGVGGTSDTVEAAEYVINKGPDMQALFWKDPRSFILETARLYPAVAGMGARMHEDTSFILGNGRNYSVPKGEFVYNWNAGANIDPNVFGGAQKAETYALTFDPARDNLDRLVTWNAEFGNILECSTVGCPGTAARPCPGARLSLYVAEEVSKLLFKRAGQGSSAKSEL